MLSAGASWAALATQAACELAEAPAKLFAAQQRIAALDEEALAIATTPKEEVWREDMVRLYRYLPDSPPARPGPAVLLAYALVGRYQMVDLEAERSFVRKLLAAGLRVYVVDWGTPGPQHRWVGIDDYVNGYLDACVDTIRAREGVAQVNLLGVCQGGVMALCYAALQPRKVRTLTLTVTPVDFHGDAAQPQPAGGYMNRWARALGGADIDLLVDTLGNAPGPSVGQSFMMMNPVGNAAKYTLDLLDVAQDERKLLSFLRMERWLADRPDVPGEFVRQWFRDLYQDNKLVRGEFELGGRRVDLRRVTMPVLNVWAEGDVVIPPACSRDQGARFGTRDYTELAVPGGHIGTFVGGKAQAVLAPTVAGWILQRNPTNARRTKSTSRPTSP